MVDFYVMRIINGRTSLERVPEKLRTKVSEKLALINEEVIENGNE